MEIEEIRPVINDLWLHEIGEDGNYNLQLVVSNDGRASQLNSSLSGRNRLSYKYIQNDILFLLKIHLLDYNQVFVIPVRIVPASENVMPFIDKQKIIQISVAYAKPDHQLSAFGQAHSVEF